MSRDEDIENEKVINKRETVMQRSEGKILREETSVKEKSI